ncbi:LysR family transcriptional regulator [Variovorax paradoxus]|nr:LysR family transcriptional regulator [Variovorax paradoxus]
MTRKTDQRLRLTLRQLEVFAATAREGSTRAAAGRVARSQSAASASLADLEAALGTQLFDRIGRRLVLNEDGRSLLAKSVSLVEQAAELQAMFFAEHRAPLRIAASFTIGEYLMPDIVLRWKQDSPQARARLIIGNTADVISAVVGFDADVGFIEGRQTHPDLAVRQWLTDEMVLVAAPAHPLAGRPVGVRELAGAGWVLREEGSGTREATDRWLIKRLGPLDIELELGSSHAIKRVLASGVGIGCMSRYAVSDALEEGSLVELQTRLPREFRALSIVSHRERRPGHAMQEFVEYCRKFAAERPGRPLSRPRQRVHVLGETL